MGRRVTRREEPVRRGRPGERKIASGNGQFPRRGRAEEPREPQGEVQNSHPSRENPVTHGHSRGIGQGKHISLNVGRVVDQVELIGLGLMSRLAMEGQGGRAEVGRGA